MAKCMGCINVNNACEDCKPLLEATLAPREEPLNRSFLRELAKRAKYHVYQRSTHGCGPAYDWGPKSPMLGSHFTSEEAAWRDVEDHIYYKMQESAKLLRISQELVREGFLVT